MSNYELHGKLFKAVKMRAAALEKAEADLANAPLFFPQDEFMRKTAVKYVLEEIADLRAAEPYYFEPDILKLILQAGKKIPNDTPFHRCWLRGQAGWWWFGENSGIPIKCSVEREHENLEAHAMMWRWKPNASVELTIFSRQHHEPTDGPVPIAHVFWYEGDTLEKAVQRVNDSAAKGGFNEKVESDWAFSAIQALQVFACGSLWLQQKVIVVERTQVPKALGKKLRKVNLDPTVNVIQLRRREYVGAGEKRTVDWQVRWMVGAIDGGFWRNQKTKDGHELIWIFPYIKGPDDKPLKLPGERIYHVNR